MDTYIILGGGYWQKSVRPDMGGYQVDPEDAEKKATVDYLVKINGLPNGFFQPTEVIRKFKYYCELDKRWIPQWEIEKNIGCIVAKEHTISMEYRDVPIWEPGAVGRYGVVRQPWMKPCFRIMLNHSKGITKWQDIWRYIDRTLPVTQRRSDKLPRAVGDRLQWTIMESEVPVIDLPYDPKKDKDPLPPIFDDTWKKTPFRRPTTETASITENDTVICQICDKEVKGKRGLFAHMKQEHKINIHKEKEQPTA